MQEDKTADKVREEKKKLREKAVRKRASFVQNEKKRALEDAALLEVSQRLPESVGLGGWQKVNKVFLYASFGAEAPTWDMMDYLEKHQVPVYLPRVEGKRHMEFHLYQGEALETSRFGIQEPPDSLPVAVPDEATILIVPGLLFDRRGRRLGYGGGYYDAYLRQHPAGVRVGLCYYCQLSRTPLPVHAFDENVSYLITSFGTIKCLT